MFLIRFLLAILAVGLCCLTLVGFVVSYDTLLSYIVVQSGKPYLLPLLRDRFFTPQKFIWSRYALLLLSILYGLGLALVWSKLPYCSAYLQVIAHNSKHYWQWFTYSYRLIPPYLKIILGISFGICIIKAVYYLQYPIQYDEAWTYNYFIANSPIISLAAYNNHPLLTLIGHLFKQLPFDMHINLRLPVCIVGFACIVLLFAQLRRLFGVEAAVIGTIFFAFSCPITFYMLYARGYIFTVLFTQLLLLVHFPPIDTVQQTTHLAKVRLSVLPYLLADNIGAISFVALGLYSMPIFIYALMPFFAYHIIGITRQFFSPKNTLSPSFSDNTQEKNVKSGRFSYFWATLLSNPTHIHGLFTLLLGLLLALCFYLPMLLGTGIGLGIGVASNSLSFADIAQQFARYVFLVWYFFTGTIINYGYIIIFSLLSFWAIKGLVSTQQKHITILAAGSICLPIVVLWLQRVAVPERAWTFLSVYIALLIAAISYRVLSYIAPRFYRYLFISALTLVLIVGQSWLIYQHDFVNWSYNRDYACRQITQLMLQANINTYYTNFDYLKPCIEYYYRLSNSSVNAFSADPNSANYAILEGNSTQYDCIISNKDAPKPIIGLDATHYLVFENEEIRVYFGQKNNGGNNNCP